MTHWLSTRGLPGSRPIGSALSLCAAGLLTGCLAQQADLAQMERTLGAKITKLDQRERELQAAVKQAKVDVDKLVSETRARLGQEITVLRDEDLPAIRGALDKEAHQILLLRNRLDDIEDRTAKRLTALAAGEQQRKEALQQALKAERDRIQEELGKIGGRLDALSGTVSGIAKTLGGRLDEQDKTLRAGDARATALAQRLEAQARTSSEEILQLTRALGEFRQALASMGEKLVQVEQGAHTESQHLVQRLDALQGKVEHDTKTTSTHLADVNKSVGSVAKAVETVGGRFAGRLDEQDQRLSQLTASVEASAAQLTSMTAHINKVTQAVMQLQEAQEALRHSVAQLARQASAGQEAVPVTPGPAPESTGQAPEAPGTSQPPASEPRSDAPHAASGIKAEPGTAYAAVPPVGSATGKELYDRSLQRFKAGDFDGAQRGFAEYLTRFPRSSLAPNAQYWLGECYSGKKDYTRAIEAFDRVLLEYPGSDKVPAALLKKGFAYLALKDRKRAVSVLREVIQHHPRSAEAGKAADKLTQLKGQ